MDFQKQFDTVTGALNIFDMSYLVSGATMLGVFVYAFPGLKDFVFHKDQVTVSIIICIVIAYVLGMISWIAGKQFRYWMMKHFGERDKDADFEFMFSETATHFTFKDELITKLIEENKKVAFSYMWMRLDNSQDEDCRNRFVYISRFWVLRAIYEGLMLPVLLLFVSLLIKHFTMWRSWFEVFNQWQSDWSGKVIYSWAENIIVFILGVCIMATFTYCIMDLLANEARRCANTQIREVIVAYYHLVEEKSLGTEEQA